MLVALLFGIGRTCLLWGWEADVALIAPFGHNDDMHAY